ncbi:acyltransferase domain-containing protein, partial [Nocardiopsis mangrovi]
CGVRPVAVVGHSQGEVAAACVAGVLSLEDAARLIAVRSRLIAGLAGDGGMLAVALPEARTADLLASRWAGRVGIAAVNGPASVVVSGERGALAEVEAACAADGVHARWVSVGYAAHSPRVDALRAPMLEELAGLRPGRGEIAFHSSVTGEREDGTALGAGYWFDNLRRPVLFERAVRGLHGRGHTAFIEISPHPVLALGLRQTVEDASGVPGAAVLGTLRREEGGADRFLTALAEAHVAGVDVDWAAVYRGSAARVDLPTYAFQHRRYWLDPGRVGEGGSVPVSAPSDGDAPLDEGTSGADSGARLRAAVEALAPVEREAVLLELVRDHTARALGHAGAADVEPRRGFMDAGVDSLTAMRLRDRINAATGLRLPTTAVFEHATPVALAERIGELLADVADASGIPADLDRLEAALSAPDMDEEERARTVERLRRIVADHDPADASRASSADGAADAAGGVRGASEAGSDAGGAPGADRDVRDASDDELFDLICEEFGIS